MIVEPKVPEVFAPLWTAPSRFKGNWGGRGSGKSWNAALYVVVRMIARPGFRVACVREIQNSLKDSVYQLIVDTIQRHHLGALFVCVEGEVRGPHGSLCIFKGLRDQNAESIKSLEGVDMVWIEEAQTLQQRSLDILRPTIRKAGSELWFTWNPRLRTDPVDVFMRQANVGDPSFLVVEAQWRDNPWFSAEMELERVIDQRGDLDRYAHIWDGAYEAESDTLLISSRLVADAAARTVRPETFDEKIIGVDVARFGDDKSAIVFRQGRTCPLPYERHAGIDTMALAARVAEWVRKWSPDAVFVDEGGVGGGVVDRLHQLGFTIVRGVNFGGKSDSQRSGEKAANKRTEMWLNMREWLARGSIPDDPLLAAELTGPMFSFDTDNAYVLEKKSDMKKRGIPSPDVADGLALTFAYPVLAQADDWRDEAEDRGRNDATGY